MKTYKKILNLLLLAAMTASLSSCYFKLSDKAKERIRLSIELSKQYEKGELDSLTYRPGEYSSISFTGAQDVFFIQTSEDPRVVVRGRTRLIDSVRVSVQDDELRVSYDEPVWYGQEVFVYCPAVKAISMSGSGDLFISDYQGESIDFNLSGSVDSNISGMALSGSFRLKKLGSGDVECINIKSAEASFEGSGSGDIDIIGIETGSLSIDQSGSSDLAVSGNAEKASFSRSGSGDLDATNLDCKDITVTGNSGSGSLSYKSEGKIIDL